MREVLQHIIKIACLIGILLTFAACSNDMDDIIITSKDDMMLSVSFRTSKAATKVSSDLYENGSAWENYIGLDENDYRIYFFDSNDNTYIASFDVDYMFTQDAATYKDYVVNGKTPQELIEKSDFKIVVLANWKTYPSSLTPGTTTIEDICSNASTSIFTCADDFSPSKTNRIPFYGVRKYTGVSFTPNEMTVLDKPVSLLRAMAKIQVNFTFEKEGIGVESVRLHNYNKKGYCAPAGVYSQEDYDSNDDGVWDYNILHLIGGTNEQDAATQNKLFNASDDKTTWVTYVPEYKNIGEDVTPSYIEVKLENSDYLYEIYFANYNAGITSITTAEYDINRNYLYKFNVTVTEKGFAVLANKWCDVIENIFEF